MHDYTGTMIVSDIDGTLLTSDRRITKRNRDAIDRFTQGGGLFTIASGRSVSSIRGVTQGLPINCPVIAYNGSMIYDLQEDKAIVSNELSDAERDYVRFVFDHFDDSTVEVYIDDICYLPRDIEISRLKSPITKETVTIVPCTYEGIPHGPWTKAAFTVPEARVDDFQRFIADNPRDGVVVVASSGRYFEIIPLGHTKGTMLHVLAELVGVAHERTIAVGDYYNDFEMLQQAGIGVCVADAPDDIKAICDYVVGTPEDGVVADILEILDKQ